MHADDTSVRPRLTADQIRSFVPEHRGAFTFPEPYNTQGVRLTIPQDGEILPMGYSYWPNAKVHNGAVHVFVGRRDQSALMISVDLATMETQARPLPLTGTAEGWYWSRTHHAIYVIEGDRLTRAWVEDWRSEPVFGAPGMWQAHSSGDDRVHSASATARHDGGPVDAVVYDAPNGDQQVIQVEPLYDECQIDKSGQWLLIKEGTANRLIHVPSGRIFVLTNEQGAAGHSDCGFGYVVGEDDYAPHPGAFRLWRFGAAGFIDGRIVYRMHGWDAMARHISHANAVPGDPYSQWALVSSAHRNDLPRANELVMVSLNGSLECRVVAPNLIDLDASGGGSDYWKSPKANIDHTGQFAVWTANCGTDRLDAFLVRI